MQNIFELNTIKVIRFAQGNFVKRHKKALGRTNKKTAEGINMKLISLYFLILFHDDSRKILEEALVLAELLNI